MAYVEETYSVSGTLQYENYLSDHEMKVPVHLQLPFEQAFLVLRNETSVVAQMATWAEDTANLGLTTAYELDVSEGSDRVLRFAGFERRDECSLVLQFRDPVAVYTGVRLLFQVWS
jgi:hypothetical protein